MSQNFPENTLIVVADGTQAILYRNEANNGDLKLKKSGELGPRELLDDGPAGIQPPESSPQEIDEATFAKQLAEYLLTEAQQHRYSKLILAADPQTLGQIRPCLHQRVKSCLIKEVDKTLTNSPIDDVERSLLSVSS